MDIQHADISEAGTEAGPAAGARLGPPDHDAFPLTEIQYAYWVGRGPSFILGNVAPHLYFELAGKRLDQGLLTRTFARLIERHGMLRATVLADGRQRILPEAPRFEILSEDLSGCPASVAQERLAEIRADMSERVYDPAVWPLFDIRITRLAEFDRLHVSLDLLMVDLASITVLFNEWTILCRDEAREFPLVDISFRDYVLALERSRETERFKRSVDYWASRAENLAPPPELPLARVPAQIHKPKFSHREFQLPAAAWQNFKNLAVEHGLTPTAVLATVFAGTLAAWSDSPRFTLNLTVFNRLPLLVSVDNQGYKSVHPQLRNVIGDFTSICLVEVDTSGRPILAELATQVQGQLQRNLRHRYASALHTMRERRKRGFHTGFDGMPVVFTSGLGTASDVSGPMEFFGDIDYRLSQTPQVWIDHQVLDFTGSLDLSWDSVDELFPDGLLDDMFAAYCQLVEQLAFDDFWQREFLVPVPGRQLETRRVANDTAGPWPAGLLSDGLLRVAESDPGRAAILHSSGPVSYGELAGRAARISASITELTADRTLTDRLVAITLPKGPDQVAAAYGVLLAGAAYLPVGPAWPARRRHELYRDGQAIAVITSPVLDARLEWPAEQARLQVGDQLAADPMLAAIDRPAGDPSDLAYVIYTSGSTGHPKGVMIEHRSALNTIADINQRFRIRESDRVLGLAELSFDLSIYDLFGTMAAGATLVLPDEEHIGEPSHWADLIRQHGVTVWNSVPAQFQMLVEHLEAASPGATAPGLRLVLLSGDWIPLELPERARALWPGAAVISLGGATEASIWSNWHPTDALAPDAPSIPYGRPLRNQALHILDAGLRPRPVWVPGELYIEGAGLARGYWNDAERTAEAFVRHPETGARLYRTGDFGRYLPGGEVEFLGRRDGQVKIGGHRIECGEVESVLSRHPGVESAVVVKSADDGSSGRLLGFIVPDKSDTSLMCAEAIDPGEVGRRREALRSAADPAEPGSGQSGQSGLGAAWVALDDLHAFAVAASFRALGLPHETGTTFQAEAALSAGVARRYERWVGRAIQVLVRRGMLIQHNGSLEVTRDLPEAIPGDVLARVRQILLTDLLIPEDRADWMLAVAVSLAEVLTQSHRSAELYASDHTPHIYDMLFSSVYQIATGAVRSFVANWPDDRPLRVLEVGGGYGTLTGYLLPVLPAHQTDYLFTDISRFFIDKAKERFSSYGFMRCGLFDLDRIVGLQGYENLSVDLVIAASVLHDARRIDAALNTVRSVLAPGGTMLMVEQTVFQPWFDLAMGLQQGFDDYTDTDVRTWGHPLLSSAQWESSLTSAGFPEVDLLTRGGGGPAASGFDVIAAHGPLERSVFDGRALREYAAERLPRHMVPAHLYPLDRIPLGSTGKVDRATLARTGLLRRTGSRKTGSPMTDRQAKVAGIYREALGVREIGQDDDFLETGGDSLIAARISAMLRTAFGIDVPIGVILHSPTVVAIDAWLGLALETAGPQDIPFPDVSVKGREAD